MDVEPGPGWLSPPDASSRGRFRLGVYDVDLLWMMIVNAFACAAYAAIAGLLVCTYERFRG